MTICIQLSSICSSFSWACTCSVFCGVSQSSEVQQNPPREHVQSSITVHSMWNLVLSCLGAPCRKSLGRSGRKQQKVCHKHHSGAKDTPTSLQSKPESPLVGSKTQHHPLKKFCVVAAEQGTTFLTKQMTATTGADLNTQNTVSYL